MSVATNREPLLSIVIPIYNGSSFLGRCMDSILSQGEDWFEVVLVDDGSTDTTPEMCRSYARADKRVRWLHQDNSGVSSARNLGMDKAVGDYIWFIDCDDWITESALPTLYQCLVNERPDLVCLSLQKVDSTGLKVGLIPALSNPELAAEGPLQAGDWLYCASHVFLRERAQNVRFDTSLSLLEDRDFFYRLWINSKLSVYSIDTPLYCYAVDNQWSASSVHDLDKLLGAYRVSKQILDAEDSRGYPSNAYRTFVLFALMALSLIGRIEGVSTRFKDIQSTLRNKRRPDRSLSTAQIFKEKIVDKAPHLFVFLCKANSYFKKLRRIGK